MNVTSLEAPIFTVENLPHNTAFTLNAFSSNAKGRSDSVTLRTATTAHAEKHTTNGKSKWRQDSHTRKVNSVAVQLCQRVKACHWIMSLMFIAWHLPNLPKLTSFLVFLFSLLFATVFIISVPRRRTHNYQLAHLQESIQWISEPLKRVL